MVNRRAPAGAEYVVRGVPILPKVSANFGFVRFKRGFFLPISSEVTALLHGIALAVSQTVRMGNAGKSR